MTNPISNPELYDTIVVAGVRSPGKVTLSGHDRKIVWDVQAGTGLAGASVTLKNEPPPEFTASFYLADIDDQDAWHSFQAVIESTLTRKKRPPAGQDPAVTSTRKALASKENEIRANRPTNDQEIKLREQELEHARLAYDQAQKTALAAAGVPVMNALDIFHPYLADNHITAIVAATFKGAIDDGKGGQTRAIVFQTYKPPRPQTGALLGSGSNAKTTDPNQAALDELDALTKRYQETPFG